MNTLQKVLDFMSDHDECVIATVDEKSQPQAATVGFSTTPNLELTFGTSRNSRKYKNIQRNPNVAMVVGFKGDVTVQYEGVAHELEGAELDARKKLHFKKIPGAQEFESDPDQTYLLVKPTWVRYTDYSQGELIEELKEFA